GGFVVGGHQPDFGLSDLYVAQRLTERGAVVSSDGALPDGSFDDAAAVAGGVHPSQVDAFHHSFEPCDLECRASRHLDVFEGQLSQGHAPKAHEVKGSATAYAL